MKPTYQEIRAAAQYRWQEIHAAIGIDPKFYAINTSPAPRVMMGMTASDMTTKTETAHFFAAIGKMGAERAAETVLGWLCTF